MAIARVENGTVRVFEDSGQILKVFTPAHGTPVSASLQGDQVVVELESGQTSVHDLNGQVLWVR